MMTEQMDIRTGDILGLGLGKRSGVGHTELLVHIQLQEHMNTFNMIHLGLKGRWMRRGHFLDLGIAKLSSSGHWEDGS